MHTHTQHTNTTHDTHASTQQTHTDTICESLDAKNTNEDDSRTRLRACTLKANSRGHHAV